MLYLVLPRVCWALVTMPSQLRGHVTNFLNLPPHTSPKESYATQTVTNQRLQLLTVKKHMKWRQAKTCVWLHGLIQVGAL